MGGDISTLAVHIETAYTHITQDPIAVNTQCWPARRSKARIHPDGRVAWDTNYREEGHDRISSGEPLFRSGYPAAQNGDIVYFNGTLFGIRDLTQIYMFDQNHEPPVSLEGMPCIHTAPSLRKVGEKWEKICIGTTTSTRMDRFSPDLIGKYGVRAIIGKGGLYEGSLAAMKNTVLFILPS